MIVLGYDIPDAALAAGLPALGGAAGWFGRQRTVAKRQDSADRRSSLDEFSALIRVYEREVERLSAKMTLLEVQMKELHAQNIHLERENITLRSEVANLRGALERSGHRAFRDAVRGGERVVED